MSSYFQPVKDRLAYLCCYAEQDTKDLSDIQKARESYQAKIDDLKKVEPNKVPTWKKIDALLKERNASKDLMTSIENRHGIRLQEVSQLGRFSFYGFLYWFANKVWGSADSFNTKIKSWKEMDVDNKTRTEVDKEYFVKELSLDQENIHIYAKWHFTHGAGYSLSKQIEILFRDKEKKGEILKIHLADTSANQDFIDVKCHVDVLRKKPSTKLIQGALIFALQATKKLSENKGDRPFDLQVQKDEKREIQDIYDKCLKNLTISSSTYDGSSKEIMGRFRCWSELAVTTLQSDLIPTS